MHPFDLKTALLARHAQHVVLIHFPIALFLAGVLFDMIARWKKDATLATAAYYNLVSAAVMSVPTVITGLLAWHWQLEGQRLKGILLLHLVLGGASAILICAVCWMHYRGRRQPSRGWARYVVPMELASALVIGLTAHLGGFLSGVNGAG